MSNSIVGYTVSDDRHLLSAIALSERAVSAGNYPFGAILVDGSGRVVLEAQNTVATDRDGTAHAEINLIRAATAQLEPREIAVSTLYVSAEPCAMCAAAMCWVNIRRVVHSLSCQALAAIVREAGAPDVLTIPCRDVFSRDAHSIEVLGPHREDEARAVHETFWGAHESRWRALEVTTAPASRRPPGNDTRSPSRLEL